MKRENVVCTCLVGIFCCLSPFVFVAERATLDYQCWIAAGAVVLSGGLLFRMGWKVRLELTGTDIVVFFYLLYGGIRFFLDRENLPLAFLSGWSVLVCVYLLMRNVGNRLLVVWLWLACLMQTVLTVGQQMGYWDGLHAHFHVTGSFWNPSQLGGFIACFLPLIVAEWLERRRSVYYGWTILPMLYALALSDSRAAWLACAVGVAYVLWPKWGKRVRWGIFILICLVGAGLFFYKPLSAMGRLYVWRICWDMVRDNPLLGGGLDSFARRYMLCQADYFHQHPDAAFGRLATVVTTPYNEFVHVLVELGVVGVVLSLWIFVACFFLNGGEGNRKWRSVAVAFVVFACFSYPGTNIALMAGVVACLGAGRGKIVSRLSLSRTGKGVLLAGLLGVIVGNVLITRHYSSLAHCIKNDVANVRVDDLKNEPEALSYFLRKRDSLSDTEKLEISIRIAERVPSPTTFCDVGTYYEFVGNNEEAERWYRWAADMVPNQVRANYCLFQLYKNAGREGDAYDMASYISRQYVKVENSFTLGAQGEVSRYLKSKKYE